MVNLHSCESTQLKFPHHVQHAIPYGGSEWAEMWNWLDTHVGPMTESWTWVVSSHIQFANADHALQFSLMWS